MGSQYVITDSFRVYLLQNNNTCIPALTINYICDRINSYHIEWGLLMEYLYHYTNLASLALILKNRTVRFNSLINMDDAEEVKTKNSAYLGKYCYISSWTDCAEESIPFWGLYTQQMSGVRIKMRKCPFNKSIVSLPYYDNGNPFETYIPKPLITRNDIYLYPTIPFLREVVYTTNDDLINPSPITLLERNPNGTYNIQGNFNDVGGHKRDSWRFQSEWRYSIIVFPRGNNGELNIHLEANISDMPFDHYDFTISDEAFSDIEITTGPKMSVGDKILLESLVKEYCPSAIIQPSSLQIR